MNDEPGVFEIAASPPTEALHDVPLRPDQIQQIRDAFDRAGISEQDDCRALVNSVLVRDVASLRKLHAVEVRRILSAIEQRNKPKSTGSAWADRDEETWIDKL